MLKEQRAFIRHPADIPIEIHTADETQPVRPQLSNVSLGGLCCESAMPVDAGKQVHVRVPFVHPAFETQGRVMWCRKRMDRWELGIQFLSEKDAFRARMVEQICHIEQYKEDALRREGRVLSGDEAAREWIARFAAEFPNPGERPE
ncbi:hypothetical protein BH20GEM3_BH20GEM3_09910 [soil metagenome]